MRTPRPVGALSQSTVWPIAGLRALVRRFSVSFLVMGASCLTAHRQHSPPYFMYGATRSSMVGYAEKSREAGRVVTFCLVRCGKARAQSSPLRRQRSQVRILSGAPNFNDLEL